MTTSRLTVLGSINVDHIMNIAQFPAPGETVIGKQYQTAFGGKGANQAVACGRSGADITFIACVGMMPSVRKSWRSCSATVFTPPQSAWYRKRLPVWR